MKPAIPAKDDGALMGHRLFEQALDLWIRPEISRRQQKGTLRLPVALNAAQVIMPSPREKRPVYVRLNEEVRAEIRVKAARAIDKGELVFNQDIEDVNAIRLMKDDEPDAGHLTMMNIGGQWYIHFDFRRDKSHAADLLQRAREFYGTAKAGFQRGWLGPAVENLFAAAELAAKAELLVINFYPHEKAKDHGAIRGRYAKYANLGNAPIEGNTALNKLSRLRPAARYAEGDLHIEPCPELVEAVAQMIAHAEASLA